MTHGIGRRLPEPLRIGDEAEYSPVQGISIYHWRFRMQSCTSYGSTGPIATILNGGLLPGVQPKRKKPPPPLSPRWLL